MVVGGNPAKFIKMRAIDGELLVLGMMMCCKRLREKMRIGNQQYDKIVRS